MPTATAEIAETIITRISQAAAQKPLESLNGEKIGFNFGAATFYQDGETGTELFQTAQMRKDQTKRGEDSVLWFARK